MARSGQCIACVLVTSSCYRCGPAAWVRLEQGEQSQPGTQGVLLPHRGPLPTSPRGQGSWGGKQWARSWKDMSVGERPPSRERGLGEAQSLSEGGEGTGRLKPSAEAW